jgi:hypothetical protein
MTISNYINQNISCTIVIITMKAISSAQRDNILSLSYAGLSAHQISSRTGVCKSTVAKFIKESHPDKENSFGGCPSKLTSADKRLLSNISLQERLIMLSKPPIISIPPSLPLSLHKL